MLYLNCQSWEPYLKYGKRQFYKQKTTIYRENEEGSNGFYYLNKGIIKISTSLHSGKERIIDIVSNGKLFGEQTSDGNTYFSSACTLKDSIVYFFSYETIELITKEDIQFQMLIYSNLTDKLKTLADNVLFHKLPSEQVLARTILTLKDKYEEESIPFTQQELCRYTSLNRITVYNIFKKWDEQIISMRDKNITVKNVHALEEIAAI